MAEELKGLINKAGTVYKQNFPMETCFERAIFFSWYCGIGDCKFCYMSTQQDKIGQGRGKYSRRTPESLIAEAILCKKLGWGIGAISGGYKAFEKEDFLSILKRMHEATGEKFWLNVGPLTKAEIKKFLPYMKGYVASTETINKKVHDFVCPSKPIEPFEKSLEAAKELGVERAMTIILGIGESTEDFPLLEKFIKKHGVSRIYLYSLNPHKGTFFEGRKTITKERYAEWVARTRIAFPEINIQCGIWLDRADIVGLLLSAGANSITKFPAIRCFNSKYAKEVEGQAKLAGRSFKGTLTKMPEMDMAGIDSKVSIKIKEYLKQMKKNC